VPRNACPYWIALGGVAIKLGFRIDHQNHPATRAVNWRQKTDRLASRAVDRRWKTDRPATRAVNWRRTTDRPASRAVNWRQKTDRLASRTVNWRWKTERPATRTINWRRKTDRPASRAVNWRWKIDPELSTGAGRLTVNQPLRECLGRAVQISSDPSWTWGSEHQIAINRQRLSPTSGRDGDALRCSSKFSFNAEGTRRGKLFPAA
jgi:uncharacterized protein YmfQ (DUF2313 family)